MNLAQMVNRFAQDYGESNFNRFPISLLKEWFDEAERVINKKTKCIKGRDSTITAVSNQRVYAYPADCLDQNIDAIYYGLNSGNADKIPLIKKSLSEIRANDPYFLTRTGVPCFWYPDEQEGKYGLYPFELSVSDPTNKITIDYRKKHTKMTQLYYTGTVTVSASVNVVGSGTQFQGNVLAGDKFGVGALLSRSVDFPNDFYSVLSNPASATALTLSSAYGGASGSSLAYIVASNSSILDEEINLACVLYVMGLAYRKDKEMQLYSEMTSMAARRAEMAQYDLEHGPEKCSQVLPSGSIEYGYPIGTDYR